MEAGIYHVLNGDALRTRLPQMKGEVIVAKECLVEGDVTGDTLQELWANRAAFLCPENPDIYYQKTVSQFEKIIKIEEGAEINLWFEYDLFCQVNLWFCCWLLRDQTGIRVFLISPSGKTGWEGFGGMSSKDLEVAFNSRNPLSHTDIKLLANCWVAYKNNAQNELAEYGNNPKFPHLKEVIAAYLDWKVDNGPGRPERTLKSIKEEKETDEFAVIFREFNRREGIYGFGDIQVKRILNRI